MARNRFNVHVVEEHSETTLTVIQVTLTYAGLTVADPTCDGSLVSGSLFFTNPATRVEFGSFLPYDCIGSLWPPQSGRYALACSSAGDGLREG